MKRDLYEQAAQCFKMAGCIYKEELAYAYLHYKNARKKIQNSSEMREELYQATLKFLKLKRTKEAAKCLAMAKHYDLAAEIYEKRQRVIQQCHCSLFYVNFSTNNDLNLNH